MTSLLRPVVLDSCGGLRERRRSSVHSVVAVPRLLSASSPEECAVFDEKDLVELKRTTAAHSSQIFVPSAPTLVHLQLSNDRHSPPTTHSDDISTPSSSLPSTTHPSRKSSVTNLPGGLLPEPPKLERLRWRLASAFFAYFMCGWGDGVTGTVLPHFMQQYHISFMMSSLLYAGSTLGFMTGTIFVESIVNQLGRIDPSKNTWSWTPQINLHRYIFTRDRPQKDTAFSPSQARFLSLLVSSALHAMFFVVMGIAKGGFWVLFFAYALAAFSRSILTATLNEYFAYGSPQSIGYAYGLWSLGGTVSPLVCQSLMDVGVPWNHFYLGSLVLSTFNTAFLVLTYKPTSTESLRDCEDARAPNTQQGVNDEISSVNGSIEKYPPCESPLKREKAVPKHSKTLLLTLRQPFQWAVCLFALLYCGCETTTQSLMVSFLLGARHANPKTVGYVTSGFWGGITIGRVLWGRYSTKLTPVHRKFVILGCIGLLMQILILVVNSNVENAFSTGMIGLLYGPVFPGCLAQANDVLPPEIRMISMALISAIASFGASFFPFLAGTLSSVDNIHVVPYLDVSLAAAIVFLWAAFPTKKAS